jgi:hypothetical protein
MTRKILNRSTFIAEAAETTEHGSTIETGTVEITLAGETRRVPASRFVYSDGSRDSITARGLLGRYRTGKTAWAASLTNTLNRDGSEYESANFGRDERVGRCQKLNAIYFA